MVGAPERTGRKYRRKEKKGKVKVQGYFVNLFLNVVLKYGI